MKLRLCAFLVAVALFTPALAPHGFAAPGSEAAGPALMCSPSRPSLPISRKTWREPAKKVAALPPVQADPHSFEPTPGMRRRSPAALY